MRKISALAFAFLMVGVALTGTAMALDPNDPGDALRDSDCDGLTNLQEFVSGSDPFVADTDSGGCPDGWEVFYDQNRATYDPYNDNPRLQYLWKNYALYDSDGDGVYDVNVDPGYHFSPVNKADELDGSMAEVDTDIWSNIVEYQHGTDPTNPDTDGDGWLDDGDPEPLIPDQNGPAGGGGNSGQAQLAGQGHGIGQGPVQGLVQVQSHGIGQGQGEGMWQGLGNGPAIETP